MKKILLMLLAMVLCFSMTACGGSGDSEGGDSGAAVAEEKDDAMENATLSKEKYEELCDSDWGAMSPEKWSSFWA